MAPLDDDVRERGGRRYARLRGRIRQIQSSIASNSYAAEELESLGVSALEQGDHDAAEVYLREACLSRRDATAMARFGQLMERALEPNRAIKAYEFALAQGLRKASIALSLAHLYEQKRLHDEAGRLAREFLEELSPDSPEYAELAGLGRRIETKLGLRRRLDDRRAEHGQPRLQRSAAGPQATMSRWLRAISEDAVDGFLDCYLEGRREQAAREFEQLKARVGVFHTVLVAGASEQGEQLRVRCRLEGVDRRQSVLAIFNRVLDRWLLDSVELPEPGGSIHHEGPPAAE